MDMTETQSKRIIANVRRVFEEHDIDRLNKQAYGLITLHMGFIAHFSLQGFQGVYEDLRVLAQMLQTSEYGGEEATHRNERWADELDARYSADPTSRGCGQPPTVTAAMRGIVAVAREHEEEIGRVFEERERVADLELARKLAQKHGHTVIEVDSIEQRRAKLEADEEATA